MKSCIRSTYWGHSEFENAHHVNIIIPLLGLGDNSISHFKNVYLFQNWGKKGYCNTLVFPFPFFAYMGISLFGSYGYHVYPKFLNFLVQGVATLSAIFYTKSKQTCIMSLHTYKSWVIEICH